MKGCPRGGWGWPSPISSCWARLTSATRPSTTAASRWSTSGICSAREDKYESLGHRVCRIHRGLFGRGVALRRLRRRGDRQLLEVRPSREELFEAPPISLRGGRREEHSPAAGPAGRLRPSYRRRGDDRRHQLLPRVRLRSTRRERAHHRVHVRCGDLGPCQPEAATEGDVPVQLDGIRRSHDIPYARGRAAALSSSAVYLPIPEAGLRI